MRGKCLILVAGLMLTLAVLLPILTVDATYSSTWKTGWGRRYQHILTQAGGAGTSYQVRFVINYGNGVSSDDTIYLNSSGQTDFDDIRFTSSDGTTDYSYWRQEYTAGSSAIFWVKITEDLGVSNRTIYIYWDNAAVSTTSSGSGTFVSFTDFSDYTGWTDWYTEYGSRTVADSLLKIEGSTLGSGGNNYQVRASRGYTLTVDQALMFKVNTIAYSFNHTANFGSADQPEKKTTTNAVRLISAEDGGSISFQTVASSSSTSTATTVANNDEIWLCRNTTEAKFYKNAALVTTHTTNIPSASLYSYFALYRGIDTAAQSEKIYPDWVAIRKFADPAPAHAEYTYQDMPTIGSFSVSSFNQYPSTYYLFNVTINDPSGTSQFANASIGFYCYKFAANVTLLWNNVTNTFSELSDPNNYLTLGNSFVTGVNATAFQLSFNASWNDVKYGLSSISTNSLVYDTTGLSSFNFANEAFFLWKSTSDVLGVWSHGFAFGFRNSTVAYFLDTDSQTENATSAAMDGNQDTAAGSPSGAAQMELTLLYVWAYGFMWGFSSNSTLYYRNSSSEVVGNPFNAYQTHYPEYSSTPEGTPTGSVQQQVGLEYVWGQGFSWGWSPQAPNTYWNGTSEAISTFNQPTLSYFGLIPWYEANVQVTASPADVGMTEFTMNATSHTTPYEVLATGGTWTFNASTYQILPNASYIYTFSSWLVNGTDSYGTTQISLYITGNTTLVINYYGAPVQPPIPRINPRDAVNATWYMRSDSHTIFSQFGYQLQTVNTVTATSDVRTSASVQSVSYGVRVYAFSSAGVKYELTSGTPEILLTTSENTSAMFMGTWNCPAWNVLTSAVQVSIYQRFGTDDWSLRRIFMTSSKQNIRFPAATWTFYLYVQRLETETTTESTFVHGSSAYASRIIAPYYGASPWDVSWQYLYDFDFLGWLFSPYTYYIGVQMFWLLALIFMIVTSTMWFGSIKPAIAILWILGGSGSVLWGMIPPVAQTSAALTLAVALAITFYKVIKH